MTHFPLGTCDMLSRALPAPWSLTPIPVVLPRAGSRRNTLVEAPVVVRDLSHSCGTWCLTGQGWDNPALEQLQVRGAEMVPAQQRGTVPSARSLLWALFLQNPRRQHSEYLFQGFHDKWRFIRQSARRALLCCGNPQIRKHQPEMLQAGAAHSCTPSAAL